jgi:hypothetical protein
VSSLLVPVTVLQPFINPRDLTQYQLQMESKLSRHWKDRAERLLILPASDGWNLDVQVYSTVKELRGQGLSLFFLEGHNLDPEKLFAAADNGSVSVSKSHHEQG